MSLLGISSSAAQSAAMQHVNFLGNRKKASTGESDASGIGQLPVGAGQNLLGNALQALEQAVGAQSAGSAATTGAVSAAAPASGVASATTATGNGATSSVVTQPLQGFLHALFQTLKQDGLDSYAGAGGAAASGATAIGTTATGTIAGAGTLAATAPAPAPRATAATSGAGASQYVGSLVSSLQTLIQQLGGSGTPPAATANLNAAFSNLVQSVSGAGPGVSGSGATTPSAGASVAAATSTSSSALAGTNDLKNFLSNLLQNLQKSGLQAPALVGGNVNANV